MLLKMKDGGILDFDHDKSYTSGCETCDYGAVYTSEFIIKLTKISIEIDFKSSIDYEVSLSDIMKILFQTLDIIQEMEEMEFAEWFKSSCKEISEKFTYRIIERR